MLARTTISMLDRRTSTQEYQVVRNNTRKSGTERTAMSKVLSRVMDQTSNDRLQQVHRNGEERKREWGVVTLYRSHSID